MKAGSEENGIENSNRTFNKPQFKRYNPPTSKTNTFIEEAHLGKLINFIRSLNDEASKSQEDQDRKREQVSEEKQEPEGDPKVSINIVCVMNQIPE
jgi:hypothetical protein